MQEAPSEGFLTKLPAYGNIDGCYRYLRYIGPDNGFCNVAEIQFYGRKVDETEVGILEVKEDTGRRRICDDTVYDLYGRKTSKTERGIYCINGKKTVVW